MIIARLFDIYPERFIKKEKHRWFEAKEVSKAISQDIDSFELNHRFYLKIKPDEIIKKANRLYGPQHGAVLDICNKSCNKDK